MSEDTLMILVVTYSYLQIVEEERTVVWLFDISYFYHHVFTPLAHITIAQTRSQDQQQCCCSHYGQYRP